MEYKWLHYCVLCSSHKGWSTWLMPVNISKVKLKSALLIITHEFFLWDILRLPSSRRAALGLYYVILNSQVVSLPLQSGGCKLLCSSGHLDRSRWYCRMLNVGQHLSWRFGHVWRSRFLNLASVTSGVLFSYASIIFGEFYFSESKEPRETRVIKFSRKLSILQYYGNLTLWRARGRTSDCTHCCIQELATLCITPRERTELFWKVEPTNMLNCYFQSINLCLMA